MEGQAIALGAVSDAFDDLHAFSGKPVAHLRVFSRPRRVSLVDQVDKRSAGTELNHAGATDLTFLGAAEDSATESLCRRIVHGKDEHAAAAASPP
jgi:hypothetical protein